MIGGSIFIYFCGLIGFYFTYKSYYSRNLWKFGIFFPQNEYLCPVNYTAPYFYINLVSLYPQPSFLKYKCLNLI